MGNSSFFSRWFKRNQSKESDVGTSLSQSEHSSVVTKVQPQKVREQPKTIPTPNPPSETEIKAAEEKKQREKIAPTLTLKDVEALSPDDSIAAFLAKGVNKEVKRAALDKLFQNPIFNLRDGLNDYDIDYSQTRKLSATAVTELRQWGERVVRISKQNEPERPKTLPEHESLPSITSPKESSSSQTSNIEYSNQDDENANKGIMESQADILVTDPKSKIIGKS